MDNRKISFLFVSLGGPVKSFILLPTGIADVPVEDLDGKTPLQVARTPNLDRLAVAARLGMVRQVPQGLPVSSDAAMLSVLGYDPRRESASRGGLEAAGLGIALGEDDLALRMNFVSTFRDHLVDFGAGRIGGVEARLLVQALQEELGGKVRRFHPGLGYRNLLVLHGGRDLDFQTVPPQQVQGRDLAVAMPTGPDAVVLLEIMEEAGQILASHDVNQVRIDLKENPADRIWLWGEGPAPALEPFRLRTGRSLAVVAAAPLVRGIGAVAGAEVITVDGATGSYDTNYKGKLVAALEALEKHDVVLLHIAAANEACHETDIYRKISTIEEMDHLVVGPLIKALEARGDSRLMVTTDHMTSTVEREESTDLVPFALWEPNGESTRGERFTEEQAALGDFVVEAGHSLL
ncbi:MAG: 2,3-bisphosphoglycerate-independent phosphoglycerate mutase [Verrucomicrobiota bacterium]|nr:2,3-bisphosphoglycerate-independent phosphoglycerate mutase [Verrucomicrobiota bacterium]